ncbi:MAG: hypothetical protein AB8G99_24855 [Planctomycetaceae bacterium]
MAKTKSTIEASPWGRVTGLLTGCAVTLVGVFSQLDPHVILFRAGTGAFIVGMAVATGVSLVRTTRPNTRGRRLRHR